MSLKRLFGGDGSTREQPSAGTILDFDRLYRIAAATGPDYRSAKPFPHALIDDLVEPVTARRIAASLPDPGRELGWRRQEAEVDGKKAQFNKLGMADQLRMSPLVRQVIAEMNSGPFLQFLELLTGVKALLPDPSLQGGGVHQILPGGVLGIHADFTRHRVYGIDRRLNVLLYLNEVWKPEYGGHLELWSRDLARCERRIMPLLGRCVVFSTDSSSYHGHPEPVSCPVGQTRKSIALYYYTNGRNDDVEPTHQTDFRNTVDAPKPPLE